MNPVLSELAAVCEKSMTGWKGEGAARSDECTLKQSLFVKGRVIGFSPCGLTRAKSWMSMSPLCACLN